MCKQNSCPTDYFLFARLEFRSYCANVINSSQLRGWRYLPLILRTACALIKTLRNYSRFKMQQCVISLRRRISVTHVLAWINSFLETVDKIYEKETSVFVERWNIFPVTKIKITKKANNEYHIDRKMRIKKPPTTAPILLHVFLLSCFPLFSFSSLLYSFRFNNINKITVRIFYETQLIQIHIVTRI